MGRVLTDEEVKRFEADGFLFPFDVFSEAETAKIAERFDGMERELGEEMQGRFRNKAQLPFPWLCDLVANKRLLDAVEDLIGPDILCWGSSFFTKKAHDPRFIFWHADDFVYRFSPAETVTAWLAFHPSTVESGCVKYIPGSHREIATHDFILNPQITRGWDSQFTTRHRMSARYDLMERRQPFCGGKINTHIGGRTRCRNMISTKTVLPIWKKRVLCLPI